MEKKEQERSGFWQYGYNFVQCLIGSDRINEGGKLNEHIANAIKNYVNKDFIGFLNLLEEYPVVKKYAYAKEPCFVSFWNEMLTSNTAFKLLGIQDLFTNIQLQPNFHPLDYILSSFFFDKAYQKYKAIGEFKKSKNQIELKYINLAIKHGSYHAGCLLVDLHASNKLSEKISLVEIELKLRSLANLHGTPGYLLLAKFYFSQQLYKKAFQSAQIAEDIWSSSKPAIANTLAKSEEICKMVKMLKNESAAKISPQDIVLELKEAKSNAGKLLIHVEGSKLLDKFTP